MIQPPPRDAFPLLDWIVSRQLHECLDVAGRPVGEGRSAAVRHVQTEMRACPYAGSRSQQAKPMNVSALRQIAPAWQEILTMLSWLSHRQRTRSQTGVATGDDLAQVTGAGVFLADFLMLRQLQPLCSGEIPLVISGLYKVCLGFQLAYLPERFSDDATPAPLPDPAGFYAYLEENELLIGHDEVCSGSAEMIMQAYEAITRPDRVEPFAPPPSCVSLEIAWEQFDAFAHHTAGLWHELVLYAIHATDFLPELADPRLPADLQCSLNARLKLRADQLLAGQSGLVVELARGVREFGGRHVSAWRPEQPGSGSPPPNLEPGSLAPTVFAWLAHAAGADVQPHAAVVASDLRARLAPYDRYEATVLARVNGHVGGLMTALGLGQPDGALTASALSRVCGRTWRDWGDSSG